MLTIDEIKAAVAPICERYGVKRMTLFGSYARGEADDKSDVDLMVDLGRPMGFEFFGFYGDIERALGLEVDVLSRISTRQKFLDKIAKDEVLIYAR